MAKVILVAAVVIFVGGAIGYSVMLYLGTAPISVSDITAKVPTNIV